MPADMKLVTLYREAVHYPEREEAKKPGSRMLTMDYFDALEVRRFVDPEDSIGEFLGFREDDAMNKNDVAMQSIPLYCPVPEGKDPFDDTENGICLSLLLVYVTPEVLSRLDTGKMTGADIYDIFYNDQSVGNTSSTTLVYQFCLQTNG